MAVAGLSLLLLPPLLLSSLEDASLPLPLFLGGMVDVDVESVEGALRCGGAGMGEEEWVGWGGLFGG